MPVDLLRRLRRKSLAESYQAPPKLSDPIALPIWEKLVEHDRVAQEHQARHLRFAYIAAAVGPLAVLFLAVQVVAVPLGGWQGITLIAAELAAVFFAVCIPFLELGQAHDAWLEERVRAEVLRRELFLLAMRVGPYLDGADASRIRMRLDWLETFPLGSTEPLHLHDRERGDWRTALEDARHRSQSMVVPCLPECLSSYRAERVEEQRNWFRDKTAQHGRVARTWERRSRVVLALALVVAAFHLGLLITGEVPAWLHHNVAIVAIVLPPIGAAIVALLSIAGSSRLQRSYAERARQLDEIRLELLRLEERQDDPAAKPDEISYELKRLVLRAEEVLTQDLQTWWIILKPELPR